MHTVQSYFLFIKKNHKRTKKKDNTNQKKPSFIYNNPPSRPCEWISLSIWWKEYRKRSHILSEGKFLHLQALHSHQLPLSSVCRTVLIPTGNSSTFSSDTSSLVYVRKSRWQWKYPHPFHILCKYTDSIKNMIKQLFLPNILFPGWLCQVILLINPLLLITQVRQSLSFTSSSAT